jgi:four helix bundle protein
MARTFRDLAAFQRSIELSELIYRITEHFPRHELFGLTAQIRKASVRVLSDVAEGAGRFGYAEWRQFLGDARGSLYEVEAQALLAYRLGYLSDDDLAHVEQQARRAGAAIIGLLRWVRSRETANEHKFESMPTASRR